MGSLTWASNWVNGASGVHDVTDHYIWIQLKITDVTTLGKIKINFYNQGDTHYYAKIQIRRSKIEACCKCANEPEFPDLQDDDVITIHVTDLEIKFWINDEEYIYVMLDLDGVECSMRNLRPDRATLSG